MNKFVSAMDGKNARPTPRVTLTENGALTNSSTFNAVLDFYSKSGALRGRTSEFVEMFARAYQANKLLAIRALFQARDVRGGNGERENFRTALYWLYVNDEPVFDAVIKWVPFFGRWDDLFVVLNESVMTFIAKQFFQDMRDLDLAKPISLLAKWMPSENASSQKSKDQARQFAAFLRMTPRVYRQHLSIMRRHIRVVEQQMSARQWEDIDYSIVPSQASKLYRKAFSKHDGERYGEFIEAAKRGEKKINASTLTPVQLVQQAMYTNDNTVEALWRQLPNYMQDKNMLVVADTSGSMSGGPLETAIALALYAAERNHGPFHNRWMNFSARPRWQAVQGNTLYEKIYNMDRHDWDQNTDLEALFRLILNTAVQNHLPPEDMPAILAIISDMQFDEGCGRRSFTTYETIKAMYRQAGYELPVLVFWNVRASHGQPVTKSDRGVILVSGESAAAFKGLMACDVEQLMNMTPYQYMLDQLNGERYGQVTL